MAPSRLRLRERVGLALGLPVRFLLGQDPIRRLRQMPGDGDDGFGMILAVAHSRIEATDVSVRLLLAMLTACLGRFRKGPFQVVVHVGPRASKPGFVPTGVNARGRTGVRGEVLRVGKAVDISYL